MTSISHEEAKKRLILALDVPNIDAGLAVLDRVQGEVGLVKIGLQLFTANGPGAVEQVKKRGFDIFLDLKMHDIPNTVAKGVASARELGVSMLTVHAGGGPAMLKAAAEAAGADLKLLAVTLLTSMDAEDLAPSALIEDPTEVVRRRAELAGNCGIGGIVCSPKEVTMVRGVIPSEMSIVTPGIRPAGAAMDDQKRAATPASSIGDGADYLVVGRPIYDAEDPAASARTIVGEIAEALGNR